MDTQKAIAGARQLFHVGKFKAAVERCNEIIPFLSDKNEIADVFNIRGAAKDKMGDIAASLADYNQAIAANPQHAKAYGNRGLFKIKVGDYKGAVADFDLSLKIAPQYAWALDGRGVAKDNLGDHNAAIADFNKALEIEPQNAKAYNNRGFAKSKMGDYENALADYDRALAIDPEDKTVIYNRAAAATMQESQKGREEVEAKYQAQLQAQQEKFDRNLQEQLQAQQEKFDRNLQAKLEDAGSETKDISKELEYEKKRERYDDKLGRQKALIEESMTELKDWSKRVYGTIVVVGGLYLLFSSAPNPFLLLPFIITGTLLLFPLGWRIRMLNRDKHKYWALREDADAKIKMARIILINPALQKELIVKLFDHHDKRGSANLIADWDRADTGDGNSPVGVFRDIVNRINPGDNS